jgi:1-acyl-sn-glycerol-3-phosphate acyltransferase
MQFLSILLLPFSKRAFRAYNRRASSLIFSWWSWGLQRLVGIRICQTGDPIAQEENAIIISNHQSMADIPIVGCLAAAHGRAGDLKWFAKDVLKYIPGIGWGMMFLECVFVKRSWSKDESNFRKAFSKFKTSNLPIWMILFPEGTRFRPHKLDAANRFAKSRRLPPLRNVLFPRPKGFYSSVIGLRDYLDTIYSVTISYQNKAPTLWELVTGEIREVHCHIRKVSISDLPKDEQGLSRWLREEFYLKDEMLETGDGDLGLSVPG